jgi:hypothetical protein
MPAFEAPNVSAPTPAQMSSQSVSAGSSMTGVIERIFEGDETAHEPDTQEIL